MRRMSTAEGPVLQGSLFKLKTGLLKSWQKRFFRIEGDRLVYYKEREDLEHLGWIDLSDCVVQRSAPEEPNEPFAFALEVPGRRYVLRASKKEHHNLWCEVLEKWVAKFTNERNMTLVKQPAFGAGLDGDKSPRRSPRPEEEVLEEDAPVLVTSHTQALTQVHQILEKVKTQENFLNTAIKKVEKFKQKAFALQEMLEFQRDAVSEPAKRINSLMKGYTSLERALEDITRSMGGSKSVAGAQEAEMRMRLVVQRAEGQLVQEKRMRKELEERLFRSEVMAMKLNELLSGRDVNWLDANALWVVAQRDQVPSSEFGPWIQQKIVNHSDKRIV